MAKNATLKILNPILAVLFVSQVLSGIFSSYLSPETFQWLHRRGAIALVAGTVLHVVLNWNWVRATLLPRKSR
jgi:hypothetical protein